MWHMNEVLINRWIATVDYGDLVFHLGDFGFGKYPQIEPVLRRLPGRIILIKGNHDRASNTKLGEAGFIRVYKNFAKVTIQETKFLLSHRPIRDLQDHQERLWRYKQQKGLVQLSDRYQRERQIVEGNENLVNLCGHVHEKWTVRDFSINVGVDVHGFRPISLEEITMMIPELKKGVKI